MASSSGWERLREADLRLQAAHDQRRRDTELKKRRDQELQEWIAEAKAKAAKEAKRNRPITVKRFKVG